MARPRRRKGGYAFTRPVWLMLTITMCVCLGLAPSVMAADTPVYGGIYRTSNTPPRSLDPHMETASQAPFITTNIYNTLLRFNPEMNGVEPELAKSWRQIDDLTYEFKLVEGVKFHDVPPANGREMTSEDIKYSIERISGMHGKKANFKHRYYFEDKIDTIETPDKYTVIIKTKKPYAPFIKYISSPWSAIVAKEVVEANKNLKRVAVGTGAFMLEEHVKGSHISLKKNPNYWKKGLPYLDGINVKFMRDPTSVVTAFIAGKLDGTGVYYHFLPTLKKKAPDAIIEKFPGNFMWILRTPPWIAGKQELKPPFDKIEVRRAIAMAIDKQKLLKLAWGGYGTTQVGPVPQTMIYTLPKSENITYDPEGARKLLAEAGYPNGFSTELMTWNLPYMTKPAQVIKEMLKEVGIDVKLNLLEMAQYFNKAYRFKYDMALHIMTAGFDPEEWLVPYFGNVATSTYYKWSNPELWEMIDKQSGIMDPAKRETYIQDIQRKVLEDSPNVFLYSQTRFIVRRPYVHLKQYYLNDFQPLYGEQYWMEKH